ncbi:unnamed protein product [Schistosoma margrebowiei]|uniref:Uncharacterized protein n=1 Tax=Schistosoma margrebowiei TaxID=48269 RepID=A0AA84ZRA0_9TREM|nr:unnamed protein product [Schistosoma margrebowiei]
MRWSNVLESIANFPTASLEVRFVIISSFSFTGSTESTFVSLSSSKSNRRPKSSTISSLSLFSRNSLRVAGTFLINLYMEIKYMNAANSIVELKIDRDILGFPLLLRLFSPKRRERKW